MALRQTDFMSKITIVLLGLIFQTVWAQAPKETLNFKTVPKGSVISQAVAQVGNHVITSREVIISNIIDQALMLPVKKGAPIERKDWLLKEDSEAFQKHLAQILLEMVVQSEAENFSIGQVAGSDIAVNEKHLEEQVKGWTPWKQLEVSSAEIHQSLNRKMRAKNFLKFKTETSGVQISDDEAKVFYEKNRVKFGNMPFAQFKDSIKEVLAQEQLQEKLKDWFDILKRKYRVKYLGKSN
jgi:hypothetical protein